MHRQRIDRRAFRDATLGHELSTESIALDPRLAEAGLEGADTNGDGSIGGEEELDALFNLMAHSQPGRERGRASRTMLKGVADQMRAPQLSAMIDDIDRARRESVLLVGMNDSSMAEARALRRHADVLYVGDLPSGQSRVPSPSGPLDLAAPADVDAFVRGLPLSAGQRGALGRLLLDTNAEARRELGMLAATWSAAEDGGTVPARLMLSGHGDDANIFGSAEERIPDQTVVALARIMPRAAAQVRSLHLAACQHGYEPRMAPFLAAFPNLDSVWGYSGFAPAQGPARQHQAIWERATRGLPEDGGRLRRSSARGTRRANAVSVWTRARGFDGPPLREFALIHREIEARRPLFQDLMSGRVEMNDARHAELTDLYNTLQEMTAHPDYARQREDYTRPRDRMRAAALRLRFYPAVARNFSHAHARLLEAGYAALGLVAPDFASLSRPEALQAIASLEAQVGPESPESSRRLISVLERGLGELDERTIPVDWIEAR